MVQHVTRGDWTSFAQAYLDPIETLVVGPTKPKVHGVVVCAILAHKVAKQLKEALKPTGVPFLHVADFLARHVGTELPEVKTLSLIGLKSPDNGLTVLVPTSGASFNEVNRGMLEVANVTPTTKVMFVKAARALVERGARAIILGSTEPGFVTSQEDIRGNVPLLNAATIHAEGVANRACVEA
ncbi:uncharacterized protein BKA55DRAFT_680158 [Fusarium redolens]|uniref:Uncharacterized protein n=1 Tax=Fusarium redolens TaxID=48865 RepID=A0A9P9G3D5_FUSRE|nr:uncharacterized protein BKA55DRAFT_680158 [Fusarium redolens]KAH7231726.1 hypothetical protein BKA55DRAFT_680158 [Fusarium redolens]